MLSESSESLAFVAFVGYVVDILLAFVAFVGYAVDILLAFVGYVPVLKWYWSYARLLCYKDTRF
jgi:hypothetical protein